MHSDHDGYTLITAFGSLGGSQHTTHDELMGGRTPSPAWPWWPKTISDSLALADVQIEEVGRWAFAAGLTNNITAEGLRYIDQWGALRYAANTAMLAGIAAKQWTQWTHPRSQS